MRPMLAYSNLQPIPLTANGGIAPAESIRGLDTDPRFIALTWKTVLTVSHFTTQFALFGERLTEVVAANLKTMQELDLVPVA